MQMATLATGLANISPELGTAPAPGVHAVPYPSVVQALTTASPSGHRQAIQLTANVFGFGHGVREGDGPGERRASFIEPPEFF